jgi:cytosine/adenosine deaminase-related metal-dependent hydrolase
MTDGEAQASVKLAVAEMLKSGTTCFLECLVSHLQSRIPSHCDISD